MKQPGLLGFHKYGRPRLYCCIIRTERKEFLYDTYLAERVRQHATTVSHVYSYCRALTPTKTVDMFDHTPRCFRRSHCIRARQRATRALTTTRTVDMTASLAALVATTVQRLRVLAVVQY